MVLPITKLPSQVLRRPVEDVVFPLSKDVRRLLRDMLDTVKSARGIGLAAPQVGRNLNLALIFLEEAGVPPFFIINPKLMEVSKEATVMEEGCLSMPGVFGPVERPKKISMEFYDLDGQRHTITDDTFLARVLQHEYDHLNKTLIKDKLVQVTHGKELMKNYDE